MVLNQGVVLCRVALYQMVLYQGPYCRPDIEGVVLYERVVLYQWCYTRGWYYRPDIDRVLLYQWVVLYEGVVLYQGGDTIDLILMGWYFSKAW